MLSASAKRAYERFTTKTRLLREHPNMDPQELAGQVNELFPLLPRRPRRPPRPREGDSVNGYLRHVSPAGWPKTLPCLRCDRVRRARNAGDRMCRACRGKNADVDILAVRAVLVEG